MVRWAEVVEKALEEAEKHWKDIGEPPTLRELYYRLASIGVIPFTQSAYKTLSEVLAEARMEGRFPIMLIKDMSRRSVTWLEQKTYYPSKPLTGEELLKVVESYINSYSNVTVNPWEDQRYRVIMVIEKDSLFDAVEAVIKRVFPFGIYHLKSIKGYISVSEAYNLALEIDSISEHQKPVVLYIGDYDPSGQDIARDLNEKLSKLARRKDYIFEKIAVTIDQIIELDLPCKPEKLESLMKMRRDSRYKGYIRSIDELSMKNALVKNLIEKLGTKEIAVEVEALTALKPKEFEEIIKRSIEKYFDYEVYEKVTKPKIEEIERKAEEVKKESLEALKRLASKPQG
ncbi:MAG: hypothetical protein RQ885_04580 [Desulfurococcales archaeon]|jgi:vacuolar-type H+-ATPase subunit F/Vma7|nr:hypothetical protein [Desulfurococcales archaeon]